MAATFTFAFDERPDEMGRVKMVATVRKLEDGRVTESQTSGPSADIVQHEVRQLHQRVAAFGNGNGPPTLKLVGDRKDE